MPEFAEPAFVLSRPGGQVRGLGVRRSFARPAAAARALASGAAQAIVGAIAFDPEDDSQLVEPELLEFQPPENDAKSAAAAQPPNLPAPQVFISDAEAHLARVARAVRKIREGGLEKVVLSRGALAASPTRFNPASILARLVAADPGRNGYLVALGDPAAGQTPVLVGSSPEVLIRKDGRAVGCHPLAGSAPRSADPVQDKRAAELLRGSAKDLREHQFVVDAIKEALSPYCSRLDIPDRPVLTATGQMWHLGTPISGQLADPETSALQLAIALHPTPAVGGTPTREALNLIREEEPDRGFYAGAVGWCGPGGDGEWMVAIRCATISADRKVAVARAGGGVVAESDPAAELAETDAKFATIFAGLGVSGANPRNGAV